MNHIPDPTPRFADHELDELLGAYALHAVDDDERAAVEEYLDRSPRAMAEVNELREAAAWLGNSSGELPRDLWSQIALRLEVPDSVHRPGQENHPPTDHIVPLEEAASPNSSATDHNIVALQARRRRSLVASAVVAALVVVVFLGTHVLRQTRQLDRQRSTLSAQRAELTVANERAASVVTQTDAIRTSLAERNRELAEQLASVKRSSDTYELQVTRLRNMPSTRSTVLVADGQPVAEALLGERGDGFIVGLHLPALAQDHTYQLWGVKENTILSLGVLGREPGIVPIAAAGSWSKLVLTVETSPGVAVSTQPALAVGDLI